MSLRFVSAKRIAGHLSAHLLLSFLFFIISLIKYKEAGAATFLKKMEKILKKERKQLGKSEHSRQRRRHGRTLEREKKKKKRERRRDGERERKPFLGCETVSLLGDSLGDGVSF